MELVIGGVLAYLSYRKIKKVFLDDYKEPINNKKGEDNPMCDNIKNKVVEITSRKDNKEILELKELKTEVKGSIEDAITDDDLETVQSLTELWIEIEEKLQKEQEKIAQNNKKQAVGAENIGYRIGSKIGTFVGGIKDGFARK